MRSRTLRRALALAASAMVISTTVVFADQINPIDGDTLTAPPNISVKQAPGPNDIACSALPEDVPGSATLNWNSNQHFNNGATLTLSATTPSGVSVVFTGGTSYALGTWTSATHTDRVITFTTTVGSAAVTGNVTIKISGPGYTATGMTQTPLPDGLSVEKSFSVTVDCASSNTAPSIAVDEASVQVTEGSKATNSGTASDPDGDPLSLSASIGSVVDNGDGTWDWSYDTVDGPDESQTVTITADDGTETSSVTFDLVVDNADPVVSAPAFSATSVDCGTSVDLTGISFSDAGLIDFDWGVDIDWGDGSNTTYFSPDQGDLDDQSHTYTAGGTYTANVSVTDHDGGEGNADSSNTLAVNQYRVSFLQPLDGSSPSKLIANTMKKGRVVPIKVVITDLCTGQAVTGTSGESVSVSVKTAAFKPTATDAVESFSDAGASSSMTTSFRWSDDGFWIYNLDTTGFKTDGTCYEVHVVVQPVDDEADPVTVNTTYAVLKATK